MGALLESKGGPKPTEGVQGSGKSAAIQVAALTKINGVIKWYDPTKGFGFISRGEPGDVFLHVNTLRESGYDHKSIREGMTITVLAEETLRGLQARRVIAIEELAMAESNFRFGTIKSFNVARGFGFVSCSESTRHIFVHKNILSSDDMIDKLYPGREVLVRFYEGPRGSRATEIKLV